MSVQAVHALMVQHAGTKRIFITVTVLLVILEQSARQVLWPFLNVRLIFSRKFDQFIYEY